MLKAVAISKQDNILFGELAAIIRRSPPLSSDKLRRLPCPNYTLLP